MARIHSVTIERGTSIDLRIDEQAVQAFAGETIATVLLQQGITIFNRTANGQPRGPYCNMGACFECQVQVAAAGSTEYRWVRACMLTAREGMRVISGASLPRRLVTAEDAAEKSTHSKSHESGN
jgi:hypothetical protein